MPQSSSRAAPVQLRPKSAPPTQPTTLDRPGQTNPGGNLELHASSLSLKRVSQTYYMFDIGQVLRRDPSGYPMRHCQGGSLQNHHPNGPKTEERVTTGKPAAKTKKPKNQKKTEQEDDESPPSPEHKPLGHGKKDDDSDDEPGSGSDPENLADSLGMRKGGRTMKRPSRNDGGAKKKPAKKGRQAWFSFCVLHLGLSFQPSFKVATSPAGTF